VTGDDDPTDDANGDGEGGRYCYCLVDAPESADGHSLEEDGVGGARPYLVVEDGVGLVVHGPATPYEADDTDRVRRWLLAHQAVVDEATDAFGTPLPFRFDVVLDGDDGVVREWLRDRAGEVRSTLAEFEGRREYRTQLLWDLDEDALEEQLRERDEDLRAMAPDGDAESGRSFLAGKRYENHLREARRERRSELVADLRAAVEPVAHAVTEQDRQPALADEEPLVRLAALVDEDEEGRLGERLDEVAANPEVAVRFTGPWPPYSFAPGFD
jgi:hypothetical protein